MHYYEVFVADPGYLKDEPLTYHYDSPLPEGMVVTAPVRNKKHIGFIAKSVPKPRFTTKPLETLHVPMVLPDSCLRLFDWLQAYYPSGSGSIARQFLPGNLNQIKSIPPAPACSLPQTSHLPPLTDTQQAAITVLSDKRRHIILHGDTGSGKTRVYLERALVTVAAGRSVLLLTPEIALTPQTGKIFQDVFGDRVIIVHSALTPKVRREIWGRIVRAEEPLIIIGPRSALFTPVKDVGLIIVDEAHEQAYKQEQAPRYLATRAASTLATIHNAQLILGSATPLIADYYFAEAKKLPIIRMTGQAVGSETKVTSSIIDLRDKSLFSRSPYLANDLIEAINQSLQRKEQVLVYLNRRGTARLVLCENCGWQAVCPHCDLPLTYHGDHHEMRCHTCSFRSAVPLSCPECAHTDLVFKSIGTKAITSELIKLFPHAITKRFDTDVLESERFEKHFESIKKGDVDILVGTQMLAKGLDLPKLSLVAVVAADSSLNFPDYTAAERTYQLLYQVLGRVGRGHRHGSVFVQTYQPDNPVLAAAVSRNWDIFYADQITERKLFMFPPFCFLLKLDCARKTQAGAQKTAQSFREKLQSAGLRLDINGPAPSFYELSGGMYRWQLILKAKDRGELLKVLPLIPSGWTYDLDPINLL